MPSTTVPTAWREAFERWGYLADAEARKWGLPNGATLLAKIGYIESRYNMGAVSSAGAKGGMQFIPSTREAYVERYGVDPWKSPDEAAHAAALFMKSTGLKGYNPGSSTYISEVLHAPVKKVARGDGPQGSKRRQTSTSTATSSSADSGSDMGGTLVRFLLYAAMVVGGIAMMVMGLSKLVAASPLDASALQLRGSA